MIYLEHFIKCCRNILIEFELLQKFDVFVPKANIMGELHESLIVQLIHAIRNQRGNIVLSRRLTIFGPFLCQRNQLSFVFDVFNEVFYIS